MKIAGLPVIEVDESEEITVAVRADDLPFPEPSEVGATIFLEGVSVMFWAANSMVASFNVSLFGSS